ncbi:MAG: class I SAM-dependent methyltransferase [Thermoanaerobaculia bacterium]
MSRPLHEEEALARKRTAEVWGGVEARREETPVRGWLDSPVVKRIVQERITGSPDTDWLDWAVAELALPPGGRWLSLGCGGAETEVRAASLGRFASMLALDLSDGSLEAARERARAAGATTIEFRRADLNDLDLPAGEFDVVLMCMSLHHVKELEATLAQVERALAPGGVFLVNEFVGPSQFQFTDRQLEVTRELLAALPASLATDLNTGTPKREYVRQPIEHWYVADPSEAIRSDEIVEQLERRFEVALRRDYGGAVLHLALEFIAHNFREDDEKDVAILRLAALLEERLTRHEALSNDFTVMALRRRAGEAPAPAAPAAPPDPAELVRERDRALRMQEQARAEQARLEAQLATVLDDRAAWRRRAEELDGYVERIHASGGWRLLQTLRGLAGRKW